MSCTQTTSMHCLLASLAQAYLLQNTGLIQVDHLGVSECPILQLHSLGLQVSSVGRNESKTQQAGLSPLLRSSWFLFRDHGLASGPGEDEHMDSEQASLSTLRLTVLQWPLPVSGKAAGTGSHGVGWITTCGEAFSEGTSLGPPPGALGHSPIRGPCSLVITAQRLLQKLQAVLTGL